MKNELLFASQPKIRGKIFCSNLAVVCPEDPQSLLSSHSLSCWHFFGSTWNLRVNICPLTFRILKIYIFWNAPRSHNLVTFIIFNDVLYLFWSLPFQLRGRCLRQKVRHHTLISTRWYWIWMCRCVTSV